MTIADTKQNATPTLDDHPQHHNLLADVVNTLVGGGPVTLDARSFGIRDDARFFASAAIIAGSTVVTVEAGLLTGEEVGWTFEVQGGGAADSNTQPGRQNWQGTVASVNVAAHQFTATAAPPAGNPTASGLAATVARTVEADGELAAILAAVTAAGGTAIIRFPAGRYVTQFGIHPPSGTTIEGDGQDRTIIRGLRQAPAIKCDSVSDVTIRDLTAEGAGPDGGPTGVGNATACVDILNSRHILVERVTARNGNTGFSARMQLTTDVTFRDCRADGIVKSNGTYGPASVGGIGFWLFNASDIHLDHCTAINCDRHGIYFDPGTGTAGAGFSLDEWHGFLERCSGTFLHAGNTNREGAGVAISLGGCRRGVFSDIRVYGAGLIGTPAAGVAYAPYGATGDYGDVYGLELVGDQHGEYATGTLVTGVLLRAIGGRPLIIQGVGNTVRGVKIDDFNLRQVEVLPAVHFNSYGGYDAANLLAGPDVVDNLVDGIDILGYSGDPAKYLALAQYAGGLSVPDGAGGTRTSRTLRNGVVNARPGSPVQTGVWSGGVVNGPRQGPDANFIRTLSAAGQVHYEELDLIETAGAGTYTADVLIPGTTRILDVQVLNFSLWTDTATAVLDVGDYLTDGVTAQDADGYFAAIDLKTAPAANLQLSWALADAGVGAYAATYGRGRYQGAARLIRASIVTTGAGGTSGRTRVLVIWAETVLGSAVKV